MQYLVNYFAVLVAALSCMVVGYVWYGPLFGQAWMKEMGFTTQSMKDMQKNGMGKSYGLMFVAALITAYVLAHVTEFASVYTHTTGVAAGLISGAWNWVGFMVPVLISAQLWGGKSWKLFILDGGYRLVTMLLMGVILAVWR
jgi:hypothetical protein